jgi:hypothetical protein
MFSVCAECGLSLIRNEVNTGKCSDCAGRFKPSRQYKEGDKFYIDGIGVTIHGVAFTGDCLLRFDDGSYVQDDLREIDRLYKAGRAEFVS